MPRRIKGSTFAQVIEGEWLRWFSAERWCCCDCGLVHRVQMRRRNGITEVRMFRDDRSTAQVRRHAGIKVKQKRK